MLVLVCACTKEKGMGNSALLFTSDTAVHFDTVFTSAGSITKTLKIFNGNNAPLRISNLELAGGAASLFKLNVSGEPGTQFTNVTLAANDSLYLFISVSINPTTASVPFIVEDSIRIDYNGNTQWVKLDAYGQNAHFLRSTILTQNTTWSGDLPYVLLDTFAVSKGVTLTIASGSKVYVHANTPFTVAGSLVVAGTNDSSGAVEFRNDRLDAPYNDQPGTWRGITIDAGSRDNTIRYAHIKNALEGIRADENSIR